MRRRRKIESQDTMTWLILALLGIPLWLCAIALIALVLRKRSRKHSRGIAVRVRSEPGKRWVSGRATWINDMFVFSARPAVLRERAVWVTGAQARVASPEEVRALRRVAADPIVGIFALADGRRIQVAAAPRHAQALLGPYAAQLDLAAEFAFASR